MSEPPTTAKPAPVAKLDARIRGVRRAIRARQPLQTRIDLVRERHAATRTSGDDRAPITASEAQAPGPARR